MPLPEGFIPDNTPPGFIPNNPAPPAPVTPAPGGFVPDQTPNYDTLIRGIASSMGVDPEQAVRLARFESGLNPNARSKAGAVGLMQVMPGSSGGMNIYDPVQNIRRGLQLWSDALKKAHNDPVLAYSQYYNPGFGSTPDTRGKPTPFGPIPTATTPSPIPTPAPPKAQTSPKPAVPPRVQTANIVLRPTGNGIGGMLGRAGLWVQQHVPVIGKNLGAAVQGVGQVVQNFPAALDPRIAAIAREEQHPFRNLPQIAGNIALGLPFDVANQVVGGASHVIEQGVTAGQGYEKWMLSKGIPESHVRILAPALRLATVSMGQAPAMMKAVVDAYKAGRLGVGLLREIQAGRITLPEALDMARAKPIYASPTQTPAMIAREQAEQAAKAEAERLAREQAEKKAAEERAARAAARDVPFTPGKLQPSQSRLVPTQGVGGHPSPIYVPGMPPSRTPGTPGFVPPGKDAFPGRIPPGKDFVPNYPHPQVRPGFVPEAEIGRGRGRGQMALPLEEKTPPGFSGGVVNSPRPPKQPSPSTPPTPPKPQPAPTVPPGVGTVVPEMPPGGGGRGPADALRPEMPLKTPAKPGQPILQARRADEMAQAAAQDYAANQGEQVSVLQSRAYRSMTGDQKSNLFNLLHDPERSPLKTGIWPDYVPPAIRTVLTDKMRQLREDFSAIKYEDMTPETRDLLFGHEFDPSYLFPRRSIEYALQRVQAGRPIGGLGRRKATVSAGSLNLRDFYHLDFPDGSGAPGLIKNGDVLAWQDGKWVQVGRTNRRAPGTLKNGIRIGPANPMELKSAGIHQYIEDPVVTVFEAANEMRMARLTRQMFEEWKTNPEFRDIIGTSENRGSDFVRAPELGKDVYVHPKLKAVLDRIRALPTGDPLRNNLITNLSLNISFGLQPWAHDRNLIVNALLQTPGIITRPGLARTAWKDISDFSPLYLKYLRRGGATAYLDVQRQRGLQQLIQELAKRDPRFAEAARTGPLNRWELFQHASAWKADAFLQMMSIRYLMSRGLSEEEAIDEVVSKLPQYLTPSFYVGPRQVQRVLDSLHALMNKSALIIFNPYHTTLYKSIQNTVGKLYKSGVSPRSRMGAAASIMLLFAIEEGLRPQIETLINQHMARKALAKGGPDAEYNARRWTRGHLSGPGFMRPYEGLRTFGQMMYDVARAAPPGTRLRELGREFVPASAYGLRTITTLSPVANAIIGAANALAGKPVDPTTLIPFGVPQIAIKTLQGKETIPEALADLVGYYPRYYLPNEYQASTLKKNLPAIAGQYYVLKKAGKQAEADQLLKNTDADLFTLNLAAAYDLQRHGAQKFGIGGPEAYARQLTDHELEVAGLKRAPSRTPPRLSMPRPSNRTPLPPDPLHPNP